MSEAESGSQTQQEQSSLINQEFQQETLRNSNEEAVFSREYPEGAELENSRDYKKESSGYFVPDSSLEKPESRGEVAHQASSIENEGAFVPQNN